jgi:hypothetical protein
MKVLAATAAAALVLVAAAASAATQPPTLRIVHASPLTVSGTGFAPRERVRVTLGGRVVARAVVSRSGRFVASAPSVAYDRCLGTGLSAVGTTGDRATIPGSKLLPACAPD